MIRKPDGKDYGCGVAKFGGVIGDAARLAMGVLLGPGILVGRRCVLYPGVVLSQQHIPDDLVVKTVSTQVMTERRRDAAPTGTKGCSVPAADGCATADGEVGR